MVISYIYSICWCMKSVFYECHHTLNGVGPLATLGHKCSSARPEKREGSTGSLCSLIRARAAVWRPNDGYEVAAVAKLGSGPFKLGGRGKRSGEAVGVASFYMGPGKHQRAVTAGLMAFKQLMAQGG
jgi:hypothetical protein